MTHAELVDIGRRWLSKATPNNADPLSGHYACPVVITELSAVTMSGEIPDVIGFGARGSILIECKTSLADYRADAKKRFRVDPGMGMGRQRWFLAPAGVLPHEGLPAGWGLLEVGPRGGVSVVQPSALFRNDMEAETALLVSTLRRLKVEPDGHVSIKVYAYETKSKATLTLGESVSDPVFETADGGSV